MDSTGTRLDLLTRLAELARECPERQAAVSVECIAHEISRMTLPSSTASLSCASVFPRGSAIVFACALI